MREGGTYITKAHGSIYTLHGNNDVVQRVASATASEEAALDLSVLLRRPLAHNMVKEVLKEVRGAGCKTR